jgi:hypothetical protein
MRLRWFPTCWRRSWRGTEASGGGGNRPLTHDARPHLRRAVLAIWSKIVDS